MKHDLNRIHQLFQKHCDGDDENAAGDLWQEFGLTLNEANNRKTSREVRPCGFSDDELP